MTLVKKERLYSLYFDNELVSSFDIKGTPIDFDEMASAYDSKAIIKNKGGDTLAYIGGDPFNPGATGA